MNRRAMKGSWTLLLLVSLTLLLSACGVAPISGRQQLALLPPDQVLTMSFEAYGKMLEEETVVEESDDVELVRQVGGRVQGAVERYFAQQGLESQLAGFQWEYNLVENETPNAACYPGGKVVVHTGLLPITQDATGLAAVIGHEVAHAVANHGNERMTQGVLVQLGGTLLDFTAGRMMSPGSRDLFMQAYGLGAQFGAVLPFSRMQETEADHLGVIFMAMAGYNPRESIELWRRMAAADESGGRLEFMSTHPLPATRIENLQAVMDEAMGYYRESGGR